MAVFKVELDQETYEQLVVLAFRYGMPSGQSTRQGCSRGRREASRTVRKEPHAHTEAGDPARIL
jgi:hypothetical protein